MDTPISSCRFEDLRQMHVPSGNFAIMRRHWPILIAIGALSGLAGAAIAGRPMAVDKFVIASNQLPATTLVASVTSTTLTVLAATISTVDSRPSVPIVIIGDSYTGGSDIGGNGNQNWTAKVQGQLDENAYSIPYHVYAEGGSGYVQRGSAGSTFSDLADSLTPDTGIVVVFGSRNDEGSEPAQVDEAARALYAKITAVAPQAKLLVIGPPWVNENAPTNLLAIRDVLQTAATETGATFVDPLAEGWFFGADSQLIGTDGVQPTDDGHTYMAEKILPHVTTLFPPPG